MVSDLHRWEMAWCEVLQELQTKVRYLMQTVEKPYLEVVPQFGLGCSDRGAMYDVSDDICNKNAKKSCEYYIILQ
jgi:hypothetical protein